MRSGARSSTPPLPLAPHFFAHSHSLTLFFGFRHLFKKSIKIFWRPRGSSSWSRPDPQTLLYHSRQLEKMSRGVPAVQAPLSGGWVGRGGEGRGRAGRRKSAAAAAAGVGAGGGRFQKIIKNRGNILEKPFWRENPKEAPGFPKRRFRAPERSAARPLGLWIPRGNSKGREPRRERPAAARKGRNQGARGRAGGKPRTGGRRGEAGGP